MDIKKAANATLNKITSKTYKSKVGCDREHIEWMLDGIILGYITGEKAHRWLGWAQGIICIHESLTLEELKLINYES